ncbi:tRNA (N(6)-L-threonylcarbamoyladenosine(37)-C(2))-methylthiotransferase MtaB [Candidatus Margulisiibacteriota bacterium]
MPTVGVYTFGCKVNQCDTENVVKQFSALGISTAPFNQENDYYVVNTCTVTHVADRKSRSMIRRAARLNPDAPIYVMGCYTRSNIKELQNLQLKNLHIISNTDNHTISTWPLIKKDTSKNHSYKVRHNVLVQSGCNTFCSYCIIPSVRGKPWSKSVDDIYKEIDTLIEHTVKEIIFTGINIGNYLHNNITLATLIDFVCSRYPKTFLRLSSIEPQCVTDDLIGLFLKHANLNPHLHIPLQSGSDRILKLMNRNYTSDFYLKLITKIQKKLPYLTFGTDCMVGFPGETDEDFMKTYSLLEQFPLVRIHTFKYSPRKGTPAYSMDNQIDHKIKTERSQKIISLDEKHYNDLTQLKVGEKNSFLVEEYSDGINSGLTPDYFRIHFKGDDMCGKVISVKIVSVDLVGRLVKAGEQVK